MTCGLAAIQTKQNKTKQNKTKQYFQAIDPHVINPAITALQSPSSSFNIANLFPNMTTSNSNVMVGGAGETGTGSGNEVNKSPNSSSRPVLQREISKEDFDIETMMMQKDIDNLKDILSGQITLDSSLISNLFNPNEPLSNSYFGMDGNPLNNSGINLNQQQQHKLTLELETATGLNNVVDALVDDDQPSLFELADIEDDGRANLLNTQQHHDMSENMDVSLETPLVTMDSFDTNPLLAQIRKKTARNNRNKN
jgi:hypothetical protein